jgi:hypothetical protein
MELPGEVHETLQTGLAAHDLEDMVRCNHRERKQLSRFVDACYGMIDEAFTKLYFDALKSNDFKHFELIAVPMLPKPETSNPNVQKSVLCPTENVLDVNGAYANHPTQLPSRSAEQGRHT